jgi:hypothetical protein
MREARGVLHVEAEYCSQIWILALLTNPGVLENLDFDTFLNTPNKSVFNFNAPDVLKSDSDAKKRSTAVDG